MRCPACGVENADGATVCTGCGKSLTETAAAAPEAAPRGRRLAKMAVVGLLAAALAPQFQVQRDLAGGTHFKFLGQNPAGLLFLDMGANLLFALGILLGLVALVKVIRRKDLWGGALGAGSALLGILGLAGTAYADMLPARVGQLVHTFGGTADTVVWRNTVIILIATVVCEIIVNLATPKPVEGAAPAPAEAPAAAVKE